MHEPYTVTIPADIERPDRLIGPFNARQLAVLIPGIVVVWAAYLATRTLVPPAMFAGLAIPALGVVAALALVERDGIGLDRLALHAAAYARRPRRLVPAPDGLPALPAWARAPQTGPPPAPLHLPARAIGARGTLDLGGNGVAVIVEATTVSFTLRTPAEQAALVGAFGGWLNGLSGPIQILVQAAPIDLAPAITGLRDQAAALPHPALEDAALDHARFLAELAATRDLLARRVLIVIREPLGTPAARGGTSTTGAAAGRRREADRADRAMDGAAVRALRRAEQAIRALAAAGIAATILGAEQATAVLAAATDPTAPAISAPLATPGEPITGPVTSRTTSSSATSSAASSSSASPGEASR